MRGLWLLVVVGLGFVAQPAFAESWTLVYRGNNKWVAEADNKPLRGLLAAARKGETHFEVKLPREGRALAVTRLEVLRDLLAREAKGSVLLEEGEGVAKGGTVWVGTK